MKVRKEVKLKGAGKATDLIDNFIKMNLNITDKELDFICDNASKEELDALLVVLEEKPSFADLRKALELRNSYLERHRLAPETSTKKPRELPSEALRKFLHGEKGRK